MFKKISVSLIPVGCASSIFVTILFLCYCDYSSYKIYMSKSYPDCFRNALNKNLKPIVFLFWKKGRKPLQDSCQNILNSAVDQGSQSDQVKASPCRSIPEIT